MSLGRLKEQQEMLGAIAGDIIGSVYEGEPIKTTRFPLFLPQSTFTDDTVLTVAVADAILKGGDYATFLRRFGRRYPNAGYGASFYAWMQADSRKPYGSWGNGSAMRVSPVGFAFDTEVEVLREARRSAEVTHDHPEGIRGAQATALAVFRARTGASQRDIREEISRRFGYNMERSLAAIRPGYCFEISCQRSVPESLVAFLESDGVEDAIRKAISLGGDSDTMACIAGGVAQAFFGEITPDIAQGVRARLPQELLRVVNRFSAACGLSRI